VLALIPIELLKDLIAFSIVFPIEDRPGSVVGTL